MPIGTRYQVSVCIDGQPDAGVPQLVAHISKGLAVLKQQSGKRVSKIVKANAAQPGLFQTLIEMPILDVVHVDQVAVTVAKYPVRDCTVTFCQPLLSALALQLFQRGQ